MVLIPGTAGQKYDDSLLLKCPEESNDDKQPYKGLAKNAVHIRSISKCIHY